MPGETLSQKTAAFIKERREILGLHQSDLAEKVCGSSKMKSYVSNIETGKKTITIPTLHNFLKALDSDIVMTSSLGYISVGSQPDKVAEFIKELRLQNGWGVQKLAESVYGDRNYKGHISQIEAGKKNISLVTFGHILKALNAEIAFIE